MVVDPAIVFVFFVLIVTTYDTGHLQWQTFMAVGFVVIWLGIVRTLAIKFRPDEDRKLPEGI